MRFTTYNLLNLFAADTAEARQHYEVIVAVIRALDADVLAVQEILAPDAATAAERLRRLADDAGMRCEVPGRSVAWFARAVRRPRLRSAATATTWG